MGEVDTTALAVVVPGAARVLTPEAAERVAAESGRSQRMDGIRDLLEAARTNGLVAGRFRGLLHIVIGRTISKPDGTKLSPGLTWRAVAATLKMLRFDTAIGREVGADPETLSPRDRERYWYAVIAMAHVDGPEALAEAEKLVAPLKDLGFIIGPPPGGGVPAAPAKAKPPAPKEKPKAEKPEEKPKKKKK